MNASSYVHELRKSFYAAKNDGRADSMSAYMRGKFVYFGIPAPTRSLLQKPLLSEIQDVDLAFAIAEELWELEEREFQYTACDLLSRAVSRKAVPLFDPESLLEKTQALILSKSWWDTVDTLAPNIAGHIIKRSLFAKLPVLALVWMNHDDMWVKRSALLLQLKYKNETNAELLFDLVLQVASSNEFFLRKGAGWVLREYSKTDPSLVREFINSNANSLSPLTIREGSKYC